MPSSRIHYLHHLGSCGDDTSLLGMSNISTTEGAVVMTPAYWECPISPPLRELWWWHQLIGNVQYFHHWGSCGNDTSLLGMSSCCSKGDRLCLLRVHIHVFVFVPHGISQPISYVSPRSPFACFRVRKHGALRPQKPLRLIIYWEIGGREFLYLTPARYSVTTRMILH